jgi:hypothetical protein
MKKAVWITLIVSLVLVNLVAEAVFYFSETYINMFFRISLVMGITAIASIFTGAILLIGKLEEEKPLSGHVSDTLGTDKKTPK